MEQAASVKSARYAEKEETEIPPIFKQMCLEQIREVNEVAKRLGCQT